MKILPIAGFILILGTIFLVLPYKEIQTESSTGQVELIHFNRTHRVLVSGCQPWQEWFWSTQEPYLKKGDYVTIDKENLLLNKRELTISMEK